MEEFISMLKDVDADVRRTAAEELRAFHCEKAVDALLEALNDANRGVAEASESSLLSMGGRDVIIKVIPLLADEEPHLRNFAFEMLCEIGNDSIDDILALLKDGDKDLRKYGTDILSELKNPLSVDALIETLDDADVNVGAAAAESLGEIGEKRAIPELVKKLEGDVWMQCSVIKSLSMFDDPLASEKLYDLLPKIKGMTLFSAISALGEVGGKSAIPLLISLLNEENKAFRGSVVSSLEKIINRQGDDSFCEDAGKVNINELFELLKDQDIQTKLSAIKVLGWLKKDGAVKPLVDELIDSERLQSPAKEDVRQNIYSAVIKINPIDISYILPVMTADSTNDEIRAELIDIVGRLKKDEALDKILMLKDSRNPLIRRVVARTLGEFSSPESTSALKELLRDEEGHTRGNAANSLGKLKAASADDDLIALFDDEYPDIREKAALALAQIGTISVIEKLQDISSGSSSEAKKRLALLALGKTNNPSAISILVEHLKDADPVMRTITVEAISDHSVEDSYDCLLALLHDESDEVRIATINGIAKVNATVATPDLLESLERSTHLKVKYHIVETLGRLKAREATEKFIELLNDESSLMVLAAIEALGNIQDDRALEPLKRLCENDDPEISKTARKAVDIMERGF